MSADSGSVVITGGAGFVGTHLQRELTSAWPESTVVSWDIPDIDITNSATYEEKLAQLAPKWVVHLAAIASVPEAAKNPALVQQVNTHGTQVLLETIKRVSAGTKVLFVSTADIYGHAAAALHGKPIPELPLLEAKPANPYSQSKWEAEKIIEEHFNDFVMRVRPFPHIGPGQKMGFVTADFASQIAAIEKGTQEPVLRVGNLEAQRDFTDVRDVVKAYRLLLEHGSVGEVYNVASGVGISIQQVLDILLSFSKVAIDVVQDPERMRPSDVPVLVGSAEKMKAAAAWQPAIPLTRSLQDVLDWWRTR